VSPAEARLIEVGDRLLAFTLRRSNRRTMSISVEPDQRVIVTVPVSTPDERVDTVVRRRARWIRRQQLAFGQMPPLGPLPKWVSGESHRYLGRQYRLKLIEGSEPSVKLSGGYFRVTLKQPNDRGAVQRLVDGWYRHRAREIIAERARRLIAATSWLEIGDLPPITIKALSHRWGSTTRAGRIAFNVDIVKLPPACLDYVIAHELVHLRIANHSAAYWRMLGRVMPDWQKWRQRLCQAEV